MADDGADRGADVAEQPARKPDETIAVLAVNFKKSRRVMFECVAAIVNFSFCKRKVFTGRLADRIPVLTQWSLHSGQAGGS
jgi:hypothetical protein